MKIAKIAWLVWLGICVLALRVTGWAASTNAAEQIATFNGVGDAAPAVWTITPLSNSPDFLVSIDCSGFTAVPVTGGYSLRIPGQVSSAKPGTPDVPHLAKLWQGIKDARVVLTLQGKDQTNVVGEVASAEGYKLDDSESLMPVLRPERRPDSTIYNQNQFWPAELGSVEEAWIGTQKVVRLECIPVQYNPCTKVIRFYRSLEGVLRFERF